MKVLLVEPAFPYPNKSKNRATEIHKNFVPIGLLKLGSYYKSKDAQVRLVRGQSKRELFGDFIPDKIFVTSVFTYWSEYVWETVRHYRALFPRAMITVGGIYASLHHEKKYFREYQKKYKVDCHIGLHSKAENYYPDYTILGSEINHHVTHAMRGCIRRCTFCGTWKLEPERYDKTSRELVDEINAIGKNRVIFFDNNFLANKNIKDILEQLSKIRINKRPVIYESQSGFDGRLLLKAPELAVLLKKARFRNIRIAWDNSVNEHKAVKKQLEYLCGTGFKAKDMAIFVLYNYDIPYGEMLKKLEFCSKWGVQIADCRYRPLDSIRDGYNPHKKNQTSEDYYIHEKAGWTDKKVKDFRRRVRQHNIWIRYAKDKGLKYDAKMERWSAIHNTFKFFKMGRPPHMDVLENSPTWQKRIANMNKVKNYYKENGITALDFSNFRRSQIDNELLKRIADINNNGDKTST